MGDTVFASFVISFLQTSGAKYMYLRIIGIL